MAASTTASMQPHTWLVLWIQELSPDRLPTGRLYMGLADTMKGMPWSFTCIACISPKRAKEGRPSTWPRGQGGI